MFNEDCLKDSFSDTILYIKECLRCVPKKGIAYGALRYAKRQVLDKPFPPITFNYLGQFDSSEGMWQLAREDSGVNRSSENKESSILTMIGFVSNHELHFRLETQLGDKTTQHLAERFKHHLLEMIHHCLSVNKNKLTNYSFSDFDDFVPYIQINKSNTSAKPVFFSPQVLGMRKVIIIILSLILLT